MFPFTLTLRRKIDTINEIESEKIIAVLQDELDRLNVNIIEVHELKIHFKNSFFNGQGRNHLMATVDSGYFHIDKERCELVYFFSTVRMFYILAAFSVFVALMSGRGWLGILAFIWTCVAGMTVSVVRHHLFMNRLKNKLIKFHRGW